MRLPLMVLLVSLSTMPASAICFDPSFYEDAPSAPVRYLSSKPSVPYCLSGYGYSGKHTCSQWELDDYFDDVAKYAQDMQRYYEEAVAFANEATEFANEAIRFFRTGL